MWCGQIQMYLSDKTNNDNNCGANVSQLIGIIEFVRLEQLDKSGNS